MCKHKENELHFSILVMCRLQSSTRYLRSISVWETHIGPMVYPYSSSRQNVNLKRIASKIILKSF